MTTNPKAVSKSMTSEHIKRALGLIPHPEGGYFRETYRSGSTPMKSKGSTDEAGVVIDTERVGRQRNLLTSIYWMPTTDSPIAWWCSNLSDHMHYYQLGAPLTYHLLDEHGRYSQHVLGPVLDQGQVLQLMVPGGCWKAAELEAGPFTLIGEAVAPGFDFRDFSWMTDNDWTQGLGNHASPVLRKLKRLLKPSQRRDFERHYGE